MKKFTLVTCMMLAVSSLGVWAGPVDEATAFDKAKAFLLSRGSSMTLQQTRSHRAPAQQGNGTTVSPFYVFNSEDGHGFVLVSGDTRGEIRRRLSNPLSDDPVIRRKDNCGTFRYIYILRPHP